MRPAGPSSLRASLEKMAQVGCKCYVSMPKLRNGFELIDFSGTTAYELMPSIIANAKKNSRRSANESPESIEMLSPKTHPQRDFDCYAEHFEMTMADSR